LILLSDNFWVIFIENKYNAFIHCQHVPLIPHVFSPAGGGGQLKITVTCLPEAQLFTQMRQISQCGPVVFKL